MSNDVYLMLDGDGKVVPVDLGPMMRRHRAAHVEARADVIDPAAALFADPAFDLEETYDVAEAAMPGADVNAASYIGLVLREVELNGGGGGTDPPANWKEPRHDPCPALQRG